jgi:hypothetical protein
VRWASVIERQDAKLELIRANVAAKKRREDLSILMVDTAGMDDVLELCPRGNNKDVIIIILVHDNVYIPC